MLGEKTCCRIKGMQRRLAMHQAGSYDAHAVTGQQLEGMRMLLPSLGSVPDAMTNWSAIEVMSAYLQGRMQSGSLAPGSNIGSRS